MMGEAPGSQWPWCGKESHGASGCSAAGAGASEDAPCTPADDAAAIACGRSASPVSFLAPPFAKKPIIVVCRGIADRGAAGACNEAAMPGGAETRHASDKATSSLRPLCNCSRQAWTQPSRTMRRSCSDTRLASFSGVSPASAATFAKVRSSPTTRYAPKEEDSRAAAASACFVGRAVQAPPYDLTCLQKISARLAVKRSRKKGVSASNALLELARSRFVPASGAEDIATTMTTICSAEQGLASS